MSADNWNLIRRREDGRWDVWLNLSASITKDSQIASKAPIIRDGAIGEVLEWAESQGYTEYGTTLEDILGDSSQGLHTIVIA